MESIDEGQFWTDDRVTWLKVTRMTPDRKGRVPSYTRLASMASESFGVKFTRGQIRNAVLRFIYQGEFPVDRDAVLRALDQVKTFARAAADAADSLRREIECERLEALHKR